MTIPAINANESTEIVTYWTSEDGQASIDMSGLTAKDALDELIGECADDIEEAGILAGSFELAGA